MYVSCQYLQYSTYTVPSLQELSTSLALGVRECYNVSANFIRLLRYLGPAYCRYSRSECSTAQPRQAEADWSTLRGEVVSGKVTYLT